ncbi:glycosyltransferase family 2 protein [Flavobacterium sp. CYK-4]|uniref:glycosyltransferase n=1 Tax=Flavobacterium lotistagni TaxID=2709660 RepID=UPI001408831E|nr:glycosyltransferase family A protein [Flavobacterium lotistagni]NHM08158.1 glycosyltransferase family 2 protein [Flavobacterium lotistagni]
MQYCLIIPAHNEAQYIGAMLHSVAQQTLPPKAVVIVNDHSTDATSTIAEEFVKKYSSWKIINSTSAAEHQPGSKVIRAFEKGIENLNEPYDFIVKLDADLILPEHYFETIARHFQSDASIGMVGGFAYIEKNGDWVLENLTDKDHIRGAFKAYRKECFEQIGGLKPAMGWDTVDELLAKFYGWKVVTDDTLKVKHLKPTGANYSQAARFKQGEAFYRLGYGFWITAIASAKLALMKKKPLLFLDYIRGFWKAQSARQPIMVTQEQARFIRQYRLSKMKAKVLG